MRPMGVGRAGAVGPAASDPTGTCLCYTRYLATKRGARATGAAAARPRSREAALRREREVLGPVRRCALSCSGWLFVLSLGWGFGVQRRCTPRN
eukprot:COSAG01_NODE_150_length_23941_cov_44.277200_16_plen_94_part_00